MAGDETAGTEAPLPGVTLTTEAETTEALGVARPGTEGETFETEGTTLGRGLPGVQSKPML